MKRDARAYLHDIQEAGMHIQAFTAGVSQEAYSKHELVKAAVERKFAIIGEALAQLRDTDPALLQQLSDTEKIIDVATELYRNAEITLARASEIGGVSAETFKTHLHKKGIAQRVDVSTEDVALGVKNITRFRESDV